MSLIIALVTMGIGYVQAPLSPLGAVLLTWTITATLTVAIGKHQQSSWIFFKHPRDGIPSRTVQAMVLPWLMIAMLIYQMRRWHGAAPTCIVASPNAPLYLCAWPSESFLRELGPTCLVLDVTAEWGKARGPGRFIGAPAIDGSLPTVAHIEQAVAVAADHHRRSVGPIVIHCLYGIGRSTSLTLALLVSLGICSSVDCALDYVKRLRPIVRVNRRYRKVLHEWESIHITR